MGRQPVACCLLPNIIRNHHSSTYYSLSVSPLFTPDVVPLVCRSMYLAPKFTGRRSTSPHIAGTRWGWFGPFWRAPGGSAVPSLVEE